MNSLRRSGATRQVRAWAQFFVLASALSCGSDRSAGPTNNSAIGDSLVPPDSVATPVDSQAPPSPPSDSVPTVPTPADPTLPTPTDPPLLPGDPTAPTQHGIPFGPVDIWKDDTTVAHAPEPFTMSSNADRPEGVVSRINAAREMGQKLVLTMTGGKHGRYITAGKFDWAKWKARQDRYDTPPIKAAVAAGFRDGTVLMANVMDEPQHKSWGGVMTKPLLDRMAAHVKSIFPGLPVGVSARWDFRPDERYEVMDFIVTQYVARYGSVTAWRDEVLAVAKENGIDVAFAINPINGGSPIRGCPSGSTGGKGTYSDRCRMTPAQVRDFGSTLGVAGCALVLWRYEEKFWSKPENHAAFQDLAATLSTKGGSPCRRQ